MSQISGSHPQYGVVVGISPQKWAEYQAHLETDELARAAAEREYNSWKGRGKRFFMILFMILWWIISFLFSFITKTLVKQLAGPTKYIAATLLTQVFKPANTTIVIPFVLPFVDYTIVPTIDYCRPHAFWFGLVGSAATIGTFAELFQFLFNGDQTLTYRVTGRECSPNSQCGNFIEGMLHSLIIIFPFILLGIYGFVINIPRMYNWYFGIEQPNWLGLDPSMHYDEKTKTWNYVDPTGEQQRREEAVRKRKAEIRAEEVEECCLREYGRVFCYRGRQPGEWS